MMFVPFHINGAEWTCRTEVFAGSATDTARGVDGGNLERFRISGFRWNHGDGIYRTVACTVAAFLLGGMWFAVGFLGLGLCVLIG